MSVDTSLTRPEAQKKTSALDRRRHRRIPITLLGRFMRENKQEFPCKILDISVGGVAMQCPTEIKAGEKVVAYFDHIGGVEGRVTRTFRGGFAIELVASQHKQQKLASQITWLVDPSSAQNDPSRRHDRVALAKKNAVLKIDGDLEVPVEVVNISISGASLATTARPPLGTEVQLGKLRARVVRHLDDGFGVEFLDVGNRDVVRRNFGMKSSFTSP